MAEKATIARPYARAAFEYAHEHGRLPAWSAALAVASQVIADPQVEPLLDNPLVSAGQLVDLIDGIAGGQFDEHGRNFLALLAQNRRLPLLPIIAAMYEELRSSVENTIDVEVTSAHALSDAQRERLSVSLGKRFKRQVRLQEKVDPALVGGAVVRAGDLVIDGSLKGRLERMSTELVS